MKKIISLSLALMLIISPVLAGQPENFPVPFVTDGNGGIMADPNYKVPDVPVSTNADVSAIGATSSSIATATSVIPAPEEESIWWSILKWLGIILGIVGVIIIMVKALTYFKRRQEIKNEQTEFTNREKNLAIFEAKFLKIQDLFNQNTREANLELTKLMTPAMYDFYTNIRSENEERGYTNTFNNFTVQNVITTNYYEDEETNEITQSVKIRFTSIDYTTDQTGKVTHGSKTEPMTDVVIWTFLSQDNGKTWKLSAEN